jgi:general nucleoside transport system permease protein
MSFDILDTLFFSTVIAAAFRIATPILFAALGEAVAERAGMLNIGIEGMMALGALGGFLGAYWSGQLWIGFVAAIVVGILTGLAFGYITIERGADHVVTGIVANIFCFGVASVTYRFLFAGKKDIPQIPTMRPFRMPWLSDLDFFGRAFFTHLPIVWVAIALVPIFWFLLARTKWGLNVRAVGENPAAAETAGVDVWRVRFSAIAVGGGMAALGGATLSIAQLGAYLDNMTAGRGFIALAVVVFGGWRPMRIAGACLLFGGAEALQLRLQAIGVPIPNALLTAVPYLLTIIVITAFAGTAAYPAAMNQLYRRRNRRTRRLRPRTTTVTEDSSHPITSVDSSPVPCTSSLPPQ